MVKFIDSNVFVYALLDPKRQLKPSEIQIKNQAREIIKSIERGTKATISVVHLSEVANIIAARSSRLQAQDVLDAIFLMQNIEIISVSREQYILANELSKRIGIGINDCLAFALMRKMEISEIYSFDRDFDRVEGLVRLEN